MKIDKKTIVAIALCVIAVLVVVMRIKSGFTPSKPAAKPSAKTQAAAAATESQTRKAARREEELSAKIHDYNKLVASLEETDIPFEAKTFRNPMKPLVSEADKKSGTKKPWEPKEEIIATSAVGYTIEGIVWDDAQPLALINNQVVGVGDQLDDGSRILEITKQRVRFTKKGREYFLEFREE
jgi:hypothetical protein